MEVFHARSEDDVKDIVANAAENATPLELGAGGTKRGLGRPVFASAALDLSALSGIVSYEPEELVLTVRAGTKLTEIEALLEEMHQRLGFDPADWGPLFGTGPGLGTIGGVLSADTSGSARIDGMGSMEEAQDLALVLRAGALPALSSGSRGRARWRLWPGRGCGSRRCPGR